MHGFFIDVRVGLSADTFILNRQDIITIIIVLKQHLRSRPIGVAYGDYEVLHPSEAL